MPEPETDTEKTAEAARAYLASLPPDQAQAIQALSSDEKLAALIKLAERESVSPWPSLTELTGQRNAGDLIDWEKIRLPTSSSRPG